MMKKSVFILAAAFFALGAGAAAVNVDPAKAEIVVPAGSSATVRFAAMELQDHLKMVTGKKIPIAPKGSEGKYHFLFAKPAEVKLKAEEAVWEVGPKVTRFYGDSDPGLKANASVLKLRRTGDLTAVYDFLEKQLKFLFLAPGPLGTSYEPAEVLKLETGKNSWDPGRLVKRGLRYSTPQAKAVVNSQEYPEFYRKKAVTDLEKRDFQTRRWLKQMRMGGSALYTYGHAFTRWWARYGKTHPEYFALYKGKRYPWNPKRPDIIKMCPSNRNFINQIVQNWKAAPNAANMINVCENDWGCYCECDNCRALDAPPAPGARWDRNLTDRYLYLANEVIKEARKTDPKVKVSFYAYSVYRFPPQKFNVEPGIVIGFVPQMMNWQKTDEMYKAWRAKGADEMFQRPNDQHINTGLPMGIEELLFRHFQIGVKNGMTGTDYDSLHSFWASTGIADYILARGHVDPSKSFEYWMDEYCSAYGAAAPEVKAYYAYYRKEIFEKRLYPNRKVIQEKGRYGNFRRGLMWDLGKYYKESDFDATDAILKKGLAKKLTARQKSLLEQLLLSNLHARMTYHALSASGPAKIQAAKKLHNFREENWDKINMHWYNLFRIEAGFGDTTGGRMAEKLKKYADGRHTGLNWKLVPDPDKVGDKEQWYLKAPKDRLSALVRVENGWENPGSLASEKFRNFIKNYDGDGWYYTQLAIPPQWKGKEVYLLFAGVDESAWVYCNGKLSGSRVSTHGDDWKKSFDIRIDQNIDWSKKKQNITVKVNDRSGQGGIYRPVVIAVK